MPTVLRVLLSVLFLMVMAIFLTWFVVWRQEMCDTEAAWEFVTQKSLIFVYSTVIIFFTLCVISAALWRPFLGAGIVFSVLSVLTFIHMQKMQSRSEPLFPEDLLLADQAGHIAQFVDPWLIVRLVLGIVLILLGAGLLEFCTRRTIGRNRMKTPWWEKYALLPRISFTMLSLVALVLSTSFLVNHEMDGFAEDLKVHFGVWDPKDDYRQNGLIFSFLYFMGDTSVAEPTDYSEDNIRKIAEHYEKIKRDDKERKSLDEVADNIIVILNETFYDPEILADYYPHNGGDVVPNLHKIFRNYPSGYMYSPVYGGGTANAEFEVMTGLTTYCAATIPYVNTIPKLRSIGSVASWAKQNGFETTAIHAYDGTMYKRNVVYQKMGYDTFIADKDMQHTAKENGHGYISDSETYKEVLDVLKDGEKSHLIGVVTMQNHIPYGVAGYDKLNFGLTVPAAQQLNLAAWFESLHKSDEYLGEFLSELDKLEQKTVVLWFGDHAAGVLDELNVSEDGGERDLTRLTPYFIYANFEIESDYTVAEVKKINQKLGFDLSTKGIDLPVTTPNCLLNTMYNVLNAEKTPLMYVLDEVCTVAPILMRSYSKDDEVDEEKINDYKLINYDILNGKHYWPE